MTIESTLTFYESRIYEGLKVYVVIWIANPTNKELPVILQNNVR